MKVKNENSFVRSMVFCFAMATALFFSSATSFCQDQKNLKFENCETYEDSCLVVGKMFIGYLSEIRFEDLAYLFSDSIHFRALLPPALVTANNPSEAAIIYKNWFYIEDPEKFEIVDSKAELMVDCQHISYRIYVTRQDKAYKVEQHLFCEVASGKIQKLSLLCSGPRRINI